jgi:hypothetical protein
VEYSSVIKQATTECGSIIHLLKTFSNKRISGRMYTRVSHLNRFLIKQNNKMCYVGVLRGNKKHEDTYRKMLCPALSNDSHSKQ